MKYDFMKNIDEEIKFANSNDNKNLLCSEDFLKYARNLLTMISRVHFPELDGFEVPEGEVLVEQNSLSIQGIDRNNCGIYIDINSEGMVLTDYSNTLYIKVSSKNMSTLSADTEIIIKYYYNGDIVTVNKTYDNKLEIDVYTDIETEDLSILEKDESSRDLIPDYSGVFNSAPTKNAYNYSYSIDNLPFIHDQADFYAKKESEWNLNFLRLKGMEYADACHRYRQGLDLRVYKKSRD